MRKTTATSQTNLMKQDTKIFQKHFRNEKKNCRSKKQKKNHLSPALWLDKEKHQETRASGSTLEEENDLEKQRSKARLKKHTCIAEVCTPTQFIKQHNKPKAVHERSSEPEKANKHKKV